VRVRARVQNNINIK